MNHTERKKKRERKKDETKRRVRSECQETQGPGGVFVSGLMWGGEGGGYSAGLFVGQVRRVFWGGEGRGSVAREGKMRYDQRVHEEGGGPGNS